MLARSFYARPAEVVAPDLLGKLLVHGPRVARIVETEAYAGRRDPASHAYKGPTPRTTAMFGPPGRLYVYFSYGVHWCANVVTGQDGEGSAVLLRGAEAVDALQEMRADRPTARRDADLLRGPGNLTKALAITKAHYGADLTDDSGVHLAEDGYVPAAVANGPRIGITKAIEEEWRWFIPGHPAVSGPRIRRRPVEGGEPQL